jgi:hypothetical protein
MNRNTDRLMRDYLSRTESGDRRSDRRRDDREDERRMSDRRMNDRNDYEYDREDEYEDGRRRRNSRGQFTDRHYESESGEHEGRLSRSDMRRWSSHLKNKDGTRGAHFDREPVRELTEKSYTIRGKFGKDGQKNGTESVFRCRCTNGKIL